LQRWGYPYTEEQFKFHISLSDRIQALNASDRTALLLAAQTHFTDLLSQPSKLQIDALNIFREDFPGAAFKLWRRYTFAPVETITET